MFGLAVPPGVVFIIGAGLPGNLHFSVSRFRRVWEISNKYPGGGFGRFTILLPRPAGRGRARAVGPEGNPGHALENCGGRASKGLSGTLQFDGGLVRIGGAPVPKGPFLF